VVALSSHELSADERMRIEGHVQQIINTEDDAPEALLSVLRRIPLRHSRRGGTPEKTHG
jgi:hypothetical protein